MWKWWNLWISLVIDELAPFAFGVVLYYVKVLVIYMVLLVMLPDSRAATIYLTIFGGVASGFIAGYIIFYMVIYTYVCWSLYKKYGSYDAYKHYCLEKYFRDTLKVKGG